MIGDLLDKAARAPVFAQNEIAAVMHFAAARLVGESVADPQKYYINNASGLLSLLAAMRDAGCRRIVFSSRRRGPWPCGQQCRAGELCLCPD